MGTERGNVSCRRLPKEFGASLSDRVQSRSDGKLIVRPIVFLLSAPRSGSTLLRLMLSGSPGLEAPAEIGLLGCSDMYDWSQRWLSSFSREAVTKTLSRLLSLDLADFERWLDDPGRRYVSVLEAYSMIQDAVAPRTLVDKTPTYAMDLDVLKSAERLFNRPKYVHLVRHPYSVIDSIVRTNLHTMLEQPIDDPYQFAEHLWKTCNTNILRFRRIVKEERLKTIRFEDLVSNPSRAIAETCQFLSVPFDDAMLNPYSGNRMVGGLGDPNILTHDRIDPGRGEVWKCTRLPNPLNESSRNLAAEFKYQLSEQRQDADSC